MTRYSNDKYSVKLLKQLSFLNKTDQLDNLTMEAHGLIRKKRKIMNKTS